MKEVTTASSGNSEGTEKTKHDPKKDKKIKMVTRDKNLLMACSYFDLNHSGYIETKDAEDILLALNLNLSRAQVIVLFNGNYGTNHKKPLTLLYENKKINNTNHKI